MIAAANGNSSWDYSSFTTMLLHVRQKREIITLEIRTSFSKLREFNTVNQHSFIARTMNSIQINCTYIHIYNCDTSLICDHNTV